MFPLGLCNGEQSPQRGARKGADANRGGQGSHRNFVHAEVLKPVVISGNPGDDAKRYQERAIEELGK